ncbi:DUF2130 domain-containing protein [Hyphococcus sp.]|uniref:DUF2130 domain-containing protein n=1 Tax=Hyphococcus sp. TaxID=2038636 RepID=UPI00208512F8|nr:MAG: hypothetical protein DHS20C04_05680 [Marinicaulis sp.]
MDQPKITCPNCSTEILLTESLAAPLLKATREEFQAKITEKELEVAQREQGIRDKEKQIAEAQRSIDEQVSEKLEAERKNIAANEAEKARRKVANELESKQGELTELQQILDGQNKKLEEAQKVQAELLRKQRELDDAKRELELTIETRVQENLADARKKAKAETEAEIGLKVSEKEEQIASMKRQIEELKRKAEQGSQQLQGEVLELELEALLQAKFPVDTIEPVAKGEFGGDVLHRVTGPYEQACGAILWESKRTKNWSDGWLTKLRGDQRTAKAEISILVSVALPKEIETFGHVDGVWVTAPTFAIPLAIALRQSLIEISIARQSQDGQQTKMELVYDYLTGPRFRHRVEAIVEKFSDMQADLNRERKSMMRLWAKREAQIQGVIESTVGMYGDLQGIAGSAIQEIEGLEIPLIEANDFTDEK